MSEVFDPTRCALGEGPMWHPLREQLFWFDIQKGQLLTREGGKTRISQFDEHVSAAGWVSETELLVASETRLFLWDIERERAEDVEALEADNPLTRSNDGRADPWGGFWIGTMGKEKEPGAGAIYRYYKGELRQLYPGLTIPNAICFAASGDLAFFTDTPTGRIWRQRLDADGWPKGEAEHFLSLPADRYRPDGAVIDAAGDFWIAHYGHGKITRHAPDGREKASHPLPASRPTCPAFGGAGLATLHVTTARQQLDAPTAADGATWAFETDTSGQPENRVIL